MDRKSMSLIETGDEFRFRGLRDSAHDNQDNGEEETRVKVVSIDVTGFLQIEVTRPNLPGLPSTRAARHSVPLHLAELLIDQRIWQSMEDVR